MNQRTSNLSLRLRLRAALALAVVTDLVQMIVFPFFWEGAASPPEDIVDVCMCGVLTWLLGWHWEFLPSFLAKLVPGVDLVPLWTLAVANVYRRSKREAIHDERQPVTIEGKIEDNDANSGRERS